MILRPVTLHNAAGDTLITLQSRDNDIAEDTPTRNYDPVQPPASNIQGVFGSPLHRIGVLERDFALCDMTGYTSVFHAKGAIERALINATSIRMSGWELPLAGPIGITEWQHLLYGLRVRLRLVPRSAHWRYLTGSKSGSGSQSGAVVTGSGFESTDVGRVLVWVNGLEGQIIYFNSASSVEVDVSQEVPTTAYTIYDAATGLL